MENKTDEQYKPIMMFDYLSDDGDLAHIHLCVDFNNISTMPIEKAKESLVAVRMIVEALRIEVEESKELVEEIDELVKSGDLTELFDEVTQTYKYVATKAMNERKTDA